MISNPTTGETEKHGLSMMDECSYIYDLEKLPKVVGDERVRKFQELVDEQNTIPVRSVLV